MRNRILLLSIVCFSIGFAQAQTTEELTVLKEAKATELTSLEAQLKDLTATVDALKTEVADLTDKKSQSAANPIAGAVHANEPLTTHLLGGQQF